MSHGRLRDRLSQDRGDQGGGQNRRKKSESRHLNDELRSSVVRRRSLRADGKYLEILDRKDGKVIYVLDETAQRAQFSETAVGGRTLNKEHKSLWGATDISDSYERECR